MNFMAYSDTSSPSEGALAPQSQVDRKVLSPWGHFEGLGVADSVPPYMRSACRVQNLFLSCWDAVSFVREIAEAKCGAGPKNSEQTLSSVAMSSGLRHRDHVEPDKAPFAEYFEVFLKVSPCYCRY